MTSKYSITTPTRIPLFSIQYLPRSYLRLGLATTSSNGIDIDSATGLLGSPVNLPLTIMQATAYLNAKDSTIAKYLRIYEKSSVSPTAASR